MLTQICDIFFNKKIPHLKVCASITKKSTRAIMENYTQMESEFGSLEHDLYELIEF